MKENESLFMHPSVAYVLHPGVAILEAESVLDTLFRHSGLNISPSSLSKTAVFYLVSRGAEHPESSSRFLLLTSINLRCFLGLFRFLDR
jgi:hypothetical protein